MKKYVKPTYLEEAIEAEDIMLTSPNVINEGQATVGEITGLKGTVEAVFDKLFKFSE